MALFITLHPGGGALLEDAPSDSCIELKGLSERAVKALSALLAVESYEISAACGELFLLAVREGQKASRRRPVVSAG